MINSGPKWRARPSLAINAVASNNRRAGLCRFDGQLATLALSFHVLLPYFQRSPSKVILRLRHLPTARLTHRSREQLLQCLRGQADAGSFAFRCRARSCV